MGSLAEEAAFNVIVLNGLYICWGMGVKFTVCTALLAINTFDARAFRKT